MPFVRQASDPHRNSIGFTTNDYLQLVDWAGRAIREGKRSAITADTPPILERIEYLEHIKGQAATEELTAIGQVARIKQAAETLGKRFIKGVGTAKRLYVPRYQM